MENIEKKARARLINYITAHTKTDKNILLDLAFMTLRELEQEAKAIKQQVKKARLKWANNNF
jgi:hypothetical protein|tara:strand:- start:2555 stop:2740 length:186 start_codon:yes stop_codon:yes gene_type:complete